MAPVMWSCGCCLSFKFSPEEIEQRYKTREIDKMLSKEKRVLKRQVKLLLLGAGESGKSTFLKQMRIIHGVSFEPELVKEYQHVIYNNIVKGMKVLIDARDKLNIAWRDMNNYDHAYHIMKSDSNCFPDTKSFLQLSNSLQCLWRDPAIKRAFERRREFQLSDSVEFFLDNLERIARLDYVPSNQDILHARKATKGISEFVIPIQNIPFRFVDVGGQRSQRTKWFQCFDSVTSILFLVSSSEFDQVLVEDRQTNRLQESLNIFDTIVNHRVFSCVPIILFFNKTDLLEKKLQSPETDLRHHFPQFQGNSKNLVEVQNFFHGLFAAAQRNPKKPLFHHFTTAVDTENVKVVFNAVKDIILRQRLETLMLH